MGGQIGGGSAWPTAPWRQKSRRIAAPDPKYPHPVLHFGWHTIIPHHGAGIAQAASFTLDHEVPKCIACFGDELGAGAGRAGLVAIECGERVQRRFERASQPAERGGLFLRDLIVERGDSASIGPLPA